MNKNVKTLLLPLIAPSVSIFLALIVGSIAIIITKNNPFMVYREMFYGAFGNKYYILTTLTRATPIIFCGLGAAIAWSSRYMGIGGEGQMIIGGFVCSIIAFNLEANLFIRIFVAIIISILFGGLYSLVSAWLLDKFKVSLAISTLMLNYIAQYITLYLVTYYFQNELGDRKLVQTGMLEESVRFPQIFENYSLHLGFIIALLTVFLVWFLMNRTSFGYESRMTGYNINFCNYGGVNSKKIMYVTLFLSGALCAFAGISEVFGVQYRYVDKMYVSGSYAWMGLSAALISGFNPIGVLFTSIILAAISTGGAAISRNTTVPLELSFIIQGCITIFISAKIAINFRKNKKKILKKES